MKKNVTPKGVPRSISKKMLTGGKKNILFVCKYNRFRSRIAEAYFKKINKNKNIQVSSAGTFRGSYPIDAQQERLCKKLGVDIRGKPRGISTNLLRKTDTIIIVSDDVPKKLFTFEKKYVQNIIVWKIPDEQNANEGNIIKIVNSIKSRVEKLVEELK